MNEPEKGQGLLPVNQCTMYFTLCTHTHTHAHTSLLLTNYYYYTKLMAYTKIQLLVCITIIFIIIGTRQVKIM